MGSLNTNGTTISQSRASVRQLGGAHSISSDRVETSTVITGNQPQFSVDNASEADVQKSALKLDDCVKITDSISNQLLERVCRTGVDL